MPFTFKLALAIATLTFSFQSTAQDTYQGQRNQLFAYNILSNGLISGIGGAINKEKDEKLLRVFAKNFSRGCLGGLIKYSAKSQTYYLDDRRNTFLAPVNRGWFFVGHSICVNSSLNQRMFEQYYYNFCGVDMTYSPYEKPGNKFKARLSLGTLSAGIYFTALGHKFDFYKSIEYGLLYFNLDPNATIDGLSLGGLATYNSMAIRKNDNGTPLYSVIPHELVHIYQNYDLFPVSNFYRKPVIEIAEKSKLYNNLKKYFSLDYEPLFHNFLYAIQPQPRYYKNFFEYEAEHFDRRGFIQR